MEISNDFIAEEERCGYMVSSETKKLWAVELDIFEKFDAVCEKHGLTYFAAGGTLLGAVRHKGYIPWDDDIDVQMPESDFLKLIELGKTEFQEPYFLQSWKTEKDNRPFFIRLRRSDTVAATKEELQNDPDRNHGIFIDIFMLSGVPDNNMSAWLKTARLKMLRQVINGNKLNRLITSSKDGKKIKYSLDPRRITWLFLHNFMTFEKLCDHYIKAASCKKQTKKFGAMAFMPGNKKLIWNQSDFDEVIDLPFEFTTIKAPKNYDTVLRQQYGDYTVLIKGTAYHTDLICDTSNFFDNK